jgi:hypothetical protein
MPSRDREGAISQHVFLLRQRAATVRERNELPRLRRALNPNRDR